MVKADKVLILGVDGMDPKKASSYMKQGKMPNLKKFVERGAAKEDLSILGNHPTVTPPMWTTLATGAYPSTHGITCFWNQDPESLDTMIYSLNSTDCKAERLWDITSLDGNKKTLVWHWPGSSWPPTNNSENLFVVDGTQPAHVYGGSAVEGEKLFVASNKITSVDYKPKAPVTSGAGCIIDDLFDENETEEAGALDSVLQGSKHVKNIMLSHDDGDMAVSVIRFDISRSPIKPAKGWAQELPEGTLEFSMVVSDGLERRPGLIFKNAEGKYDKVSIYQSKKDQMSIIDLYNDDVVFNVKETIKVNDHVHEVTRHYCLLKLAEDGSEINVWAGAALDVTNDTLFHPTKLYRDIFENVGPVPSASPTGGNNIEYVEKLLLPTWSFYTRWQADSIKYLIEKYGIEVVVSHVHHVDAIAHSILHHCTEIEGHDNPNLDRYQKAWEQVYVQTDNYLGEFLPYLDEGWTIFIVSDHGLVISSEEVPLIGDPFGVNTGVMKELGYTVLKKDAYGNEIKEIDWTKTKAVANRGNHIFINLKGRNATGIVDPEDKYELERQIIDDLYQYRLNGKRIISLAMRNRDAQILGMSGPESGDIVYFTEENHTRIHGDVLSTAFAQEESSSSPIFVAAGKGIKQGMTIERVIQQIDFAPTVTALMDLRSPQQCEGGAIFQIFED